MKTTIRAMLALLLGPLLCAFCGAAFADGVPFITGGAPLAKNHPAQKIWKDDVAVQKIHTIQLNKNAFGANILLVTIDGKERRFVGSMQKPMRDTQVWSGTDSKTLSQGGSTLGIAKFPDGTVSATMTVPGRVFSTSSPPGAGTLFVETNPALRIRPEVFEVLPEKKQ